jgi:ESS family glutamate:Na+ symporter
MQIPFPFESMLTFGGLAIMRLAGVLLRARVPLFQRFLMPSRLIGGILGLIFLNTNPVKLVD